jgi:hypothetical protein
MANKVRTIDDGIALMEGEEDGLHELVGRALIYLVSQSAAGEISIPIASMQRMHKLVTMEENEGVLTIKVTDNGPIVPPERGN